MNNLGRKLFVLLLFLIPIVLAYFTSASIFAIPIVYFYWVLTFITIFNVIIFNRYYSISKRYKLCPRYGKIGGKIIAFVVSYNEDPKLIFKTLISVKRANVYGETWLLDDSTDPDRVKTLEKICKYPDVKYVHRNTRRGYKAGAINDALKMVGDEYEFMAVFDCDQMPKQAFFDSTIGYFDNPQMAVVQAPPAYTNFTTKISSAAFYQQEVFLRIILRARNEISAFILGSGFVARISAIKSIGGFYEKSITEDIATSILLQDQGWKIVYVDITSIWHGLAPETPDAYLKQQGRWSFGVFQIFGLILNSKISFSAFIDYLSGWLYWLFIGPVRLFSFLPLILFLDFKLVTLILNPLYFAIFYTPYFIYTSLFYSHVTKENSLNYDFKGYLYHQAVEVMAMISVTSSFFSYLFRMKKPFTVTPKGVENASSFRTGFPIYILYSILIVSIVMGVIWLLEANYLILKLAIIINLFFAFYLLPFLSTAVIILITNNRVSRYTSDD